MNEDFVKGWKAARAYWSANHGSLPPYPPQAPKKASAPIPPPPAPLGGEASVPDNEED